MNSDAMVDARVAPAWFSGGLDACPVMAVLRGYSPAETVELATRAWDLGVEHVEVPIESAAAVPSLVAAVAAGHDRGRRVGAGTIVSAAHLRSAIDAGAAYAVSPGFDPALITMADRAGLPVLPGVATASEILRARNAGFVWVKAFPASVLGTPWFAAMLGPFPDLRIVATGGMNAENAARFLDAGASVVGVGAAFASDEQCEIIATLIRERSAPA